jgi:hypothetical protein
LILKRQSNKRFLVVIERLGKPGGFFDANQGSAFFDIAHRLTPHTESAGQLRLAYLV